MDHWEPAATGGLARDREVIVFNNAGISSSSGEMPTSFEVMGADAVDFIRELELTKVNVLGFSKRSFRFGHDWPYFATIPMTSNG